MFSRTGVAICAAVIAGMLLVPAELTARGGHPGGFRPMVRPSHRAHPPMVRPVHRVHPHVRPTSHVHPPLAHRHHVPFAHHAFGDRHAFHTAARRHHRAIFSLPFYGYAVPVTYGDDYAFYGSYYDPSDLVVPAYVVPPAPVPPLAGLPEPPLERVGCRSQTVVGPSPSGAEHSVTITRC